MIVYLISRRQLEHVGNKVKTRSKTKETAAEPANALTRDDWKRIGAIFIFFIFTILFWAAYEQKGASLNLFGQRLVNREFSAWAFPSSYLQSLTPLFVIMLTPVFATLWIRLKDRQPSSPAKFTLGSAIHWPGVHALRSRRDIDRAGQSEFLVARRSLLPRGLR